MSYAESEIIDYMEYFNCSREEAIEYIDYDRWICEQEEWCRHNGIYTEYSY